MHIILKVITIIIIFGVVNLLLSMTTLLESKIIENTKKYQPFNDEEYLSLIENFKKKLNITSKVYLFYNPKAFQSNCKVKVYKNEIYITIDKEVNHKKLKGSLAHELGHVKMEHARRQKSYTEFHCFLVNLFMIISLLYPFLSQMSYAIVVSIAFIVVMLNFLLVMPYILRKFELEADTIAVLLLGSNYEKCLKELSGLNKYISSIPLPWCDHPTLKSRLKNARKANKL